MSRPRRQCEQAIMHLPGNLGTFELLIVQVIGILGRYNFTTKLEEA